MSGYMAHVPPTYHHTANSPAHQVTRCDPYGRPPSSQAAPQYSVPHRPNQQPPRANAHQAYHVRTSSYPGQPLSQASPMPSPQPRLMPSQPIHGSPSKHFQVPCNRPGTYATAPTNDNRNTGRYQPSRGAQRDAKWHAKYAERAQLATQFAQELIHPQRPQHQRMHSSPGRVPPPHPGQPYPPVPYGGQAPPTNNMERIRAEQQAAIAAARQTHAAALAKKAQEEETERKTRRIQLQVFVHARPTLCCWDGCEALLNSWALLEKHIFHCHLHTSAEEDKPVSNSSEGVGCKWYTCQNVFLNKKECYQHCLVDHMGSYSARCPFNCLFEGPKFPDLMAHIGRRHPKATPDDFVPGLIHHRPLYLPPSEDDLPKLPYVTTIYPDSDEVPKSVWACGNIGPYTGERSMKVIKHVDKGCKSDKRPRKEHYADKEGASAAISALIANSHKIAQLYSTMQEIKDDVTNESDSARTVPMTADEAKLQGVELIDIKQTAKKAKDQARKIVANDLIVDIDSSSDSGSGSRPSSRNANSTRPALKVRLSGLRPKDEAVALELSESESESDSSASSRYSLYRVKKVAMGGSPVVSDGDAAAALKRSERLKRKAEECGSPAEKSVKLKS